MTLHSRRYLLASVVGLGVGALAGCQSLDNGEEDGRAYSLNLTELKGSLAKAVPFSTEAQSAKQRDVLQRAADAENGTTMTYGWQPFEDGAHAELNGTYYRVTTTQTTQTGSNERQVVYGRHADAANASDTAAFEEFPERDYPALRHVLDSANYNERRGELPDDAVHVLQNATAQNSNLVPQPSPEYVSYDGQYHRIVVETRTVEEQGIEIGVAEVADSEATFEEYARAEILDGDLSNPELSADARDVVQAAIDKKYGYDESTPLAEKFLTVLTRCGYEATREGVEGTIDVTEEHYVQYDGQHYEVRLSLSAA